MAVRYKDILKTQTTDIALGKAVSNLPLKTVLKRLFDRAALRVPEDFKPTTSRRNVLMRLIRQPLSHRVTTWDNVRRRRNLIHALNNYLYHTIPIRKEVTSEPFVASLRAFINGWIRAEAEVFSSRIFNEMDSQCNLYAFDGEFRPPPAPEDRAETVLKAIFLVDEDARPIIIDLLVNSIQREGFGLYPIVKDADKELNERETNYLRKMIDTMNYLLLCNPTILDIESIPVDGQLLFLKMWSMKFDSSIKDRLLSKITAGGDQGLRPKTESLWSEHRTLADISHNLALSCDPFIDEDDVAYLLSLMPEGT